MTIKTVNFLKKNIFVVTMLLGSGVLRWALILRGGQFYFPDESRYGIAQDAAALLLEGKVRTAVLTLVGELAHIGFKVTALIPAVFETLFNATPVLPGIFFSFFSLLNLILIWKIALAAGAPVRVAEFALFLAGCSQVLLYYSRHLFPYDQAMFFGLLALYVTLKGKARPGTFFLGGLLSSLCLVTYNGYWVTAAYALSVTMFYGEKERRWFWKRSFFTGSGFFTPLILLLLVCFLVGKDFFSDYGIYLQKITQGSFSEGWSLPFKYFWYAEHGFFLIAGILSIVSVFVFFKQKSNFLLVSLGGLLFIYLGLVIPSNVTHTFVVYGRTARQLMPFLVLAAAYGLYFLQNWKFGSPWLVTLVLVTVLAQAAWNYRISFKIVYPRQWIQEILGQYPDFRISPRMMTFYAPLICHNNGYLAANYHIVTTWPQPERSLYGDLLIRAPHPVNFRPYRYDGYNPAVRDAIPEDGFEMLFYKIDPEHLAVTRKSFENCNQKK